MSSLGVANSAIGYLMPAYPVMCHLQGSAKEWSLGCMKCAHTARGGQEAGITQPRDHSLGDPCTEGEIKVCKSC